MIDYLKLLQESYTKEISLMSEYQAESYTKFNYLADHIFDITTYEDEIQQRLSRIMLDVCVAITNKTTFDYISTHHEHYLIAVNFGFLSDKLDWGCSIRGAWWSTNNKEHIEIDTCGLWLNGEQWFNCKGRDGELQIFTLKEWDKFVLAMNEFCLIK